MTWSVASFSPASACCSRQRHRRTRGGENVEYQWVRYGMVHDESLCIGCTACMDACREVNKVPEGVSRLTIIRSEPQANFLM